MATVAVIHHNPQVDEGRLSTHLASHLVLKVWADSGDFPQDVDAAVVLGGMMGAYEEELHPWLVAEKQWLAALVHRSVPVLGICLGAQLLADALGGRAHRAAEPEVGVLALRHTPEGRTHPVVGALGEEAFFAHQDTFDLPPQATLLARTDHHPAAFELGSALAIQPHPEATMAVALSWADHPAFDLLERAGVSGADYERDLADHEAAAAESATRAFGRWFEGLGDHGWNSG